MSSAIVEFPTLSLFLEYNKTDIIGEGSAGSESESNKDPPTLRIKWMDPVIDVSIVASTAYSYRWFSTKGAVVSSDKGNCYYD